VKYFILFFSIVILKHPLPPLLYSLTSAVFTTVLSLSACFKASNCHFIYWIFSEFLQLQTLKLYFCIFCVNTVMAENISTDLYVGVCLNRL